MAENQQSIEDVQKIISATNDTSEALEEIGETPIGGSFINKWALGLTVFSFGFLCIGSFLFGATATTAVLRGVGGGILFGALLWLTGTMLIQGRNPVEEVNSEDK